MRIFGKLLHRNNVQTQVFNISLQKMQVSFETMINEAKWDTSQKMYWGYYFLDYDVKSLEQFAKKLELLGYKIVEIRNTGENNRFLLHAEEHVVHSPESLFKNCHKLAKVANENNIDTFDGWDVEMISLSKGFVE